MGVGTVVPIQEALDVNHIAGVQGADGLVNLSIGAGEVSFHAELGGELTLGQGHIDVVAGLVVLEGDLLNGQALDGDELVLMLHQLGRAQQLGDIAGLGDKAAFQDLKGGIHDFHLAGPLGLEAIDQDLGAGHQFGCVFLGAGHVVQEVSAVLALGVDGDLAVPPGLMGLDIGLHADGGIQLGSDILFVGHGSNGGLGGSLGDFLRSFLGLSLGNRLSLSRSLSLGLSRSLGLSLSRSLGLGLSRGLGLSLSGSLGLSLSRSLGLSLSRSLGLSLSRSLGLSLGGSLGLSLGGGRCDDGSLGVFGSLAGGSTGTQRQDHAQGQQDCEKLFHVHSPRP